MPTILNAVVTGRARTFDELHTAWQTDGLTTNSTRFGRLMRKAPKTTATLLKTLQATTQNRFKEIFITDSRGYVIAATNKTSDFDQGSGDDPPVGEPWWAAAREKGEHIGDIDYDESAEVYSVDINMNITAPDSQSSGVIKAIYNMENIQNMKQNRPFIGALSKGQTWYYELINRNGLLLATRESFRVRQAWRARNESEREQILKAGPSVKIPKQVWTNLTNKNGFILGEQEVVSGASSVTRPKRGEKILVGWSRGADDSHGPDWTVLAYLPVMEAYAPLYPQAKWFLTVSAIAFVVILAVPLAVANRVVEALVHREILSQELQVAYDTQMGLLPEAPNIKGLDLAGKCLTANSVGGDYYNYLWLDKGETQLAIIVGDVAGHDMSAAIPAVMFSGMLEYAIQEQTPGAMLCTLNEILCRRLHLTPFISCCNRPRAEDASLVQSRPPRDISLPQSDRHASTVIDGQLSVGDILKEVELSLGDTLIFHTDGLVEACNRQEEMYGYARMEKSVLRSCQDDVSSRFGLESVGHRRATDSIMRKAPKTTIGGINRMVADAHREVKNKQTI